MMFNFLGSYYSSVYNLYQCYLLDFIISFMVFIMVFVLVGVVVLFCCGGVVKFFSFNKKVLEFWCGVFPIVMLVVIAFCSYGLIYYDGLVTNGGGDLSFFSGPKLDVKVVGRQWF